MILTRRLVLDVLKPINPPINELAVRLCELEGVSVVECALLELDRETETIKVTVSGSSVSIKAVEEVIAQFGAALHSVDSVMVQRQVKPRRPLIRPTGSTTRPAANAPRPK